MPPGLIAQHRLRDLSLRQLLTYYVFVLACLGLFAVAPLLCALAAGWVANLAGCPLDEGDVHPCLILGWDAGPILYQLGVLGWFMLATIPVGTALMLAVSLVLVVQLVSRFMRKPPR